VPRATNLVHLGDTSFRRKEVIADYQAALGVLRRWRVDDRRWERNPALQGEFYDLLRAEAPEAFGRGGGPISGPDAQKRARTYTNALLKLGLVDDERRPTALGTMFATGSDRTADRFDRLCHLTPENSAVLRGVLSYTEPTDDGVFFPVRLLLRVLNRIGRLSTEEFATVFIAGPRDLGTDPDLLAGTVERMRSSALDRGSALAAGSELSPAEAEFVATGIVDGESFPNRKGNTYVERYRVFVEALSAFREHPDRQSLAALRRAVHDGAGTVRGRFEPGRYLPELRSKTATPQQIHDQAGYPGFHGDDADFRRGLLRIAADGRTSALVGEYLDNNLRILTATGVLSVADDQVSVGSAYAAAFFRMVDDQLAVHAVSPPAPAARAIGLVDLFGESAIARTDAAISSDYGIAPDAVQAFVDALDLQRFDAIVSAAFPPERVLAHLQRIAEDYPDPRLADALDAAGLGKTTVPCAYEYLVGLSCYYASGRSFDPRAAVGLSLDGDFLPISHAPGGRGDIEFEHGGRLVLVEVTLMDPGTQRRGELEPVLRHAVNLSCERPELSVLTLFIANEVDPNVARIFGFARLMEMTPTDGGIGTARPVIVSLSTRDWIEIAGAATDLTPILDAVADEGEHRDVEHLNGDWNAQLVARLRSLVH